MVFREVSPERQILKGSQRAIGYVLPDWHAPGERMVFQQAGTEHHIGATMEDRGDQFGDLRSVVLMIWMQHDDDIGSLCKGLEVARLLVAAVPPVLDVEDCVEPQLP